MRPAGSPSSSARAAAPRGGGAALVLWLLLGTWSPTAALADRLSEPADLDCGELLELQPFLDGGPPRRSHYLVVEEVFHRLLLTWPERGDEATALRLSELERRLSERLECLGGVTVGRPEEVPVAGTDSPGALFIAWPPSEEGTASPFVCLALIEGSTLEPIFADRPAALLAAARLYERKHAHQLRQRRLRYAERTLDQVEALLGAHSAGAGASADGRAMATVLALAAVELAEPRTIRHTEKAVALLHDALGAHPGDELALYLAAHYEEKLADYRHAREHLEQLVAGRPGDGELELRLAMNLARTGAMRPARERLRRLVASDPVWVAIVASQELARMHVEAGERAAATGLLRSALERFPESSQLRLQLAQVQHDDDWRSAWTLLDGVLNGWTADRGEPARLEYERGRPQWIEDRAAELDEQLAGERLAIAREVGRLEARSERRRRADTRGRLGLCHGTLPLRRLPGDEGAGRFAPNSPGYDG